MSGSTATITIRIPTPQELAQRAASAARQQGVADASGSQTLQQAGDYRVQVLALALGALQRVAVQTPGSARQAGTHGAEVELQLQGGRVPMHLELDPTASGLAQVRLAFTRAQGLTCAQEREVAQQMAMAFAAAGLRPDNSGGAAASVGEAAASSRNQRVA